MSETGSRSHLRIASLNGFRGIMILMVIVGHLFGERLHPDAKWHAITDPLAAAGNIGVEGFFVLSGFLITWIMLRERNATGSVSLKAFYLRRTLRIWPAYYFFLAVVAVLSAVGVLNASASEVGLAAVFLSDYFPSDTFWLAHTWSLAIEEQFYLLWPAVFIWLSPRRAMHAAVAGFLLAPLVRVASYLVLNDTGREQMWHHFQARADSLLMGCGLAILMVIHPEQWKRLTEFVGRWRLYMLAPFVLLGSVLVTQVASGPWRVTVGFTIENIAFACILIRCLTANSATARGLAWGPLGWIGTISFSLYLWQALFLTDENTWIDSSLLCVALSFAAGAASYYGIEKPFQRLKERMERREQVPTTSASSDPAL